MNFSRLKTGSLTAAALAAGFAVIVLPSLAAAQAPDLGLNYATAIGLTSTDIRVTVARIINSFLGLLGIVAVCLILYAGFRWMTAGGDQKKVDDARKIIVSAVVGLVIILSAYAITQFIFRALTDEAGISGGCPPGQTCAGGGGGGLAGGGDAFLIDGTTPVGPGPDSRGWPKNAALSLSFNAAVAADSVTDASVTVKRCNRRLSGDQPQPFDLGACDMTVAGTRDVSGGRIEFRPSDTPEDPVYGEVSKTYWEGDYWYHVQVKGGVTGFETDAVRDAGTPARVLQCWYPVGVQIWETTEAARRLCDRAFAMSDVVDLTPPTVEVYQPKSPPAYCAEDIPVQAVADDDFLASRVDLKLDFVSETGKSAAELAALQSALLDASGAAASSAANGLNVDPFSVDGWKVDRTKLTEGATYGLVATAQDLVPQASTPVRSDFKIAPAHCCNGQKDADKGETGVDCGAASGCGLCVGDSCTSDAQCASGYCDPGTGKCAERPIIDDIAPKAGGPGSLVTVTGRFFGDRSGSVVFLGGPGDADDRTAALCDATRAWVRNNDGTYEVTVIVPDGAADGPVKLVSANGLSDATDVAPGWNGIFDVNDQLLPGLCYLDPSSGPSGSQFVIAGSGFGSTMAAGSQVTLWAVSANVATGGWDASGNRISAVVPVMKDGAYPVKVRVGDQATGKTSANSLAFVVRPKEGEQQPRITEIQPPAGPAGSLITIIGSGFGSEKGKVVFSRGADKAAGVDPAADCGDTWHDNYVVIKVPTDYDCQVKPCGLSFGGHKVVLTTRSGRDSNDDVTFTVNGDPSKPGLCALRPDNGPAGIGVEIVGELFGGAAREVRFFKQPNTFKTPSGYLSWSDTFISTLVPGSRGDKATWPDTGPVRVFSSANVLSGNSIPFTVKDCNETRDCPADSPVCCPSGACQADASICEEEAKQSAFGWRFSTEVLPDLPRVVECPSCGTAVCALQSPSPYRGSSDACVNAAFQYVFNREMADVTDAELFGQTFKVFACGAEAAPAADCGSGASIGFSGKLLSADKKILTVIPSSLLERNGWYRVRLEGLKDTLGRTLDGDRNGVQGGAYEYDFRVRDSDSPCKMSAVLVVPSPYDFEEWLAVRDFESKLIADNCNSIFCPVGEVSPYAIAWSKPAAAQAIDIAASAKTFTCFGDLQPVKAVKETVPGLYDELYADVVPSGSNIITRGAGRITVNFREPEVVEYAPKCEEACVNAALTVGFSAPMDGPEPEDALGPGPDSLTAANFELWKCRNSDCQPPFETGAKLELSPTFHPEEMDLGNDQIASIIRSLSFVPAGGLQPATWYLAKVKGGPTGVKSISGAQLIGVDPAGYFSWKFRTRDSATPCRPVRAEISPDKVEFRFVGERASLLATPFGAPDGCSAEGQALDGWSYGWNWTQADSSNVEDMSVIGSFIGQEIAAGDPKPITGRLDSGAVSKLGCGRNCLHLGTQNVSPQCGNGRREKGEACDDGNNAAGDGCSPVCLLEGTMAVACGNDSIDVGEECKKVNGVFPPGCKDPAVNAADRPELNGKGCVLLGAAAGGTVCGNVLLGDGEECDDGNRISGDGCSADCLFEGTLPACADSKGVCSSSSKKCDNLPGRACSTDADCLAPCVGFCGNGKTDPGEDAGCDVAGTGIAAGCDTKTCLRTGNTASTCGNGVLTANLGEQCDDGNTVGGDGCSSQCLREGSSADYAAPSFCRDGVPGTGEEPDCEGGYAVPDGKIDPFQIIIAGKLVPADQPGGKNTAEGKVYADIADAGLALDEDKRGMANVILSCDCLEQVDPQGYCHALSPTGGPALGCNNAGCCAPAPRVQSVVPASESGGVCRNAVTRIVFDQTIDPRTADGLIVGKLVSASDTCNFCSNDKRRGCDTDADCGTGATCQKGQAAPFQLAMSGGAPAEPAARPSLWRRIASFLRSLFGREAAAAPPAGLTRLCPWPGDVTSVAGEADFFPAKAMDAGSWYKIVVAGDSAKDTLGPAVVSAEGVPIKDAYYSNFQTGSEVCKMDKTEISPGSYLFSQAEDVSDDPPLAEAGDGDLVFSASGYSYHGGQYVPIASTPDYSFKWVWDKQTDQSVIDLRADASTDPTANNGFCEPDAGETADSADCKVNLAAAAQPKPAPGPGNGVCESGEFGPNVADCDSPLGEKPQAKVSVKTSAKAGDATVSATAWIIDRGVNPSWMTATAPVTVMICDDPWPARQKCVTGSATVPWEAGRIYKCPVDGMFWVPFYDPDTKFSFYYCRDGSVGGDESELLPALKEDEIVKIKPGRDIFREYLFTFKPAGTNAAWEDDAIGLRIISNPEHYGIAKWYSLQGFGGAPAGTTVDGYDALTEGRTTYVGAGALTAAGLYTNVNVLSYSEGASPETAAVFSQVLANSNHNYGLSDDRYCVDPDGKQTKDDKDKPVYCLSDRDCRVGTDGKVIAGRELWYCSAAKSMLVRDIKRWADVQTMRLALDAARSATGSMPKLESGSFLRAISVSRWPSWTGTLASELGAVPPSDPLNAFTPCDPAGQKYDQATCWNSADRVFMCPAGSHIYQYRSVGGAAYEFSADLELTPQYCARFAASLGSACQWPNACKCAWSADSCLMKADQTACAAGGGRCVWDAGSTSCQYAGGGVIKLYGANVTDQPACRNDVVGAAAVCGDGVKQEGEECEPGVPITEPRACPGGSSSNKLSFACSGNRSIGCTGSSDNCTRGGVDHGTCNVPITAQKGSEAPTCDNSCRFVAGICYVNYCGDGVVGPGEACDDGSLNGTYGSCNNSCNGFYGCGDGQRQPNEACDCAIGGKPNGTYAFDGILAAAGQTCSSSISSANRASCSWDCKGAGPRCGDGVVNGDEKCDGDTQEFPKLCGDGKTGCNTDADCPAGKACSQACPTPDQKWRRACRPNNPASRSDNPGVGSDSDTACKWGAWGCTAPGWCGNGVKESAEMCDDGNDDNTDACVITGTGTTKTCRTAFCGDGFIQTGVEQCDMAGRNGSACVPEWGRTCEYCSLGCKTVTVTGGFCGDAKVQNEKSAPPGPEDCEKGINVVADYQIDTTQCINSDACWWEQLAKISCSSSCSYLCRDPETAVPCTYGTATWNTDALADLANLPGHPPGDAIPDICDPDIDNDGVPNGADCCPYNFKAHPANLACGIVAPLESCDEIDNDCNGKIDDTETADVLFVIDVSGSMQGEIQALAGGISAFIDEFKNSPHRFGYVTYSQASSSTADPYLLGDPYGTVDGRYCGTDNKCFDTYVSPTDVDTLQGKLEELGDNFDDAGGIECTYAAAYEVIRAPDGGVFNINWRPEAHPYVVVMTDTNNTAEPKNATCAVNDPSLEEFSVMRVTEEMIAGRVNNCVVGNCAGVDAENVEFFVMTGSGTNYWNDWNGIISEADKSYRFLPISSNADTVQTYLRNNVFKTVCAPVSAGSGNPCGN